MTALSVATEVCSAIGLTAPASLTTAGDPWSAQVLSVLNEALREASKSVNWPLLQTDYTFPTAVGVAQYAPPADFRSLIADTLYDASSYYKARGGATPAQFQQYKNDITGPGAGMYQFRIYGSPLRMNLYPVPTAIENIVLVYRSLNFATDAVPVPKPAFTADTDLPRIDDDVVRRAFKWRLLQAKGLDYSEAYNEYTVNRDRTLAEALALGTKNIGRGEPSVLTSGYVRESGFGV